MPSLLLLFVPPERRSANGPKNSTTHCEHQHIPYRIVSGTGIFPHHVNIAGQKHCTPCSCKLQAASIKYQVPSMPDASSNRARISNRGFTESPKSDECSHCCFHRNQAGQKAIPNKWDSGVINLFSDAGDSLEA
jgi:hypothetical protein